MPVPFGEIMSLVLDGKKLAQEAELEIAGRVSALQHPPTLATVLVGADPASATYVRMKQNACKRVGMLSRSIHLPADCKTEELLTQITELNDASAISGILLQHPVPAQIDERACFDAIAIDKDVDGVTSSGFGRMSMGMPAWGSCTPAGIMRLLLHHEIELSGRRAVVVGRSPILGKPMAMMLLQANATVTVCHSRSRDLPQQVARAEILVAAVGKPEFICADWVGDGTVVVDAGFHPGPGTGDVELQPLIERCAAYTPVPGGVGPMTINTLLLQTLCAAERRADG